MGKVMVALAALLAVMLAESATSGGEGCSKNIIAYYKFDYSYRDVCNGYNAINDGIENDLVSSKGISGGGFAVQLLVYSAKLRVPGLNG
ncbi:Hypothetical predicted protein [Paramuricea clavata]|uniref:Uncharacterized protein n=1 Tax=Paramuricea clavata TaxID=317549 RepID=A0A7D9D7S2_PARCT|nr:Hypothetical predicted protein [Paramuricea clavata]